MSSKGKTVLHFRFSGRLAQLLGRQSLANEIGAVFELVKNAYDADATECKVVFENFTQGTSRIRIKDNGIGMTAEDFRDKFMVVATSNKIRKRTTNQGRVIVGEKGVGRFAMESLARRVTIFSRPDEEKSLTHKLEIDWDRYEAEGITFDMVGNEFQTQERQDLHEHGLEIILENLRHPWDKEKIQRLINQLASLVAPAEFQPKLPFNVVVDAPEFDVPPSPLQSTLLDKAMYKIEARLSENKIRVSLWDRKKRVKTVTDANDIEKELPGVIDDIRMKCGPSRYIMWAFPPGYEIEEQQEFIEYYGISTWPLIEQMLEEYSGIRIYRDGFRVKPYGDKGNDWTGRNDDARNLSGALPNHSILGIVEISSQDNPAIIDTMTRSSLIENDAFDDLRNFVKSANKILDFYLHTKRTAKREKVKRDPVAQLESSAKRISRLPIAEEYKRPIVRDLREQAANIRAAKKDEKTEKERLLTKLDVYRNLASLGISVAVVAHEIKQRLGIVLAKSKKIKDQEKESKRNIDNLFNDVAVLHSQIRYIDRYMGFVRSFSAQLRTQDRDFRRVIDLDLYEELGEILGAFEELLKADNIKIVPRIQDGLPKVRLYPADLQSILVNLISNSVKAIRNSRRKRYGDSMPAEPVINNIRVTLGREPNHLVLKFSDDGPGIKDTIRPHIFEPFISEYEGDAKADEATFGSGLGLPLVKEMLESYAGSIEIGESELGSGATFLIKIPWQEIKTK